MNNLLRLARPLIPAGALLLAAGCASAPAGVASTAAAPQGNFDFTGWDGYLGGSDSSQYSSLAQIDKQNVANLQLAWSYKTGEGQPPRLNPVIGGGRMYVITGDNNIAALNPATGQEIWRTHMEGRIGARGINYWQSEDGREARLFVLNNGMLRAIDAHDGHLIDSFGTGGMVDLRDGLPEGSEKPSMLHTDNPGRIYKDTLIMALPAGAYDYASSPADIQAYDVRTGALKWVFHTVPQKGEFGYDTWPAKDHEKFGGVHNWSEFTVDPELGIAYVPTGTARYDFYGGNREGNNLFANSLIAIDANTGKRIWHYQIVHHDLWDFDLPVAPKLMTIHKDGKDIPVVIQATKHGFVFVFNRLTGEPIWPIEERPVPASDVPGEKASPTQPLPTWPQPFARQSFTEKDINPYLPEADQEKLREGLKTWRNEGLFTPPSLRGTISMPGHNGGTNWGGTAVDPVNKRFFVVSRELPLLIKLNLDKRESALAAMPNGGGDVLPYKSPVNFLLQSNGMVAIKPPFSFLTAYDMNTGKMLYHIPNGEVLPLEDKGVTGVGAQAPRGGPVATAGGVLFVGTATDRTFRARDAATGQVLWEYKLPAATEGVPTVYEVDGREYVTIPVGGVGHFAGGLGLPEAGESQYMTFALPARGQ
ncbi:pyrroloquinoline quinone-dependent dehydrogenase [Altererythrobacter sp. B11]|uniref:pyrroloquinoline quinone-dependent dehydrogenase n=1 Tax=Altererythrobacter sp. B11 TaxID=2060312 RepID=UPI000DC6EC4E|nr:pyrroloquinoline quinone-dependent dehydrogenase [Altererythrobacter sp. B11]BBC73895.1 pyrroloquinoline quinone-dependent dehydrogenase [Altererythrobacter sp. B11]